MNINREMLDKIAHLARLEVKEEDAEKLMADLTTIITWMEKLNEVNTDGIEPVTSMSHEVNAMREDVNQPHIPREQALENAPQKDDAHFRVPKVLE
jgi:aspartyl-tRNA(Asn)/glutamyl-tRNA(Gln) amidotransferase subunit C